MSLILESNYFSMMSSGYLGFIGEHIIIRYKVQIFHYCFFLFTSFDHVEKHWIAEHIKEKKFLAYSDGYQIFGLTKWTFFNDSKVPLNKQITISNSCFSFVQ